MTWQRVAEDLTDYETVVVTYAGESHTANFLVCTVEKLDPARKAMWRRCFARISGCRGASVLVEGHWQ